MAAGTNPASVTIIPSTAALSGKFAYVANRSSNTISVYAIDQTTGALTAGTAVATGTNPDSVTIDPSGRFAYAANYNSNTISVYTIDQITGDLIAGTAVAAGTNPVSVTIIPSTVSPVRAICLCGKL
ncbi:MAG: lactonase family protein [Desulfosudis oleivorans]|nr:lactonase family protein [Desulfosudis oleivorans]